ncbi:MAG: DUF721 domain-containing protein [Planctomycetota bacterium]|nr:MAG: DUF721 domain-containing protein [Planctomycetota bacterium]
MTEPTKIKDILNKLRLPSIRKFQKDLLEVQKQWANLIPAAYLSETLPVSLRTGQLKVQVSHPAILQELSAFHRTEILIKIHQILPHLCVDEIRFCLGGNHFKSPSSFPLGDVFPEKGPREAIEGRRRARRGE